MAGITLAIAEAKLSQYLDAEQKILLGQETDIDGDRLTLANLDSVQAGIKIWDARVKELTPSSSGGGFKLREIIPR